MERIGDGRGPRPCVWDQDGLRVDLDHGCHADMTWRMTFDSPVDVTILVERLVAMGLRDESRFPRVRELEERAGHRLVLVSSTGRIQLRLHYLTATGSRREEAQRIAALLVLARSQL